MKRRVEWLLLLCTLASSAPGAEPKPVVVPGPASWRAARQEAKAASFLTPEEAVAACTVRSGFQVNMFAAEPMITQPMAFCWDDKGRMWVAENRDYETRRHGFSKFGDSRVLILEDTDGDGSADTRKVFLEGIPFPAAIAVGFGGLWLGAPPNLLFVPDADGDDRADMERIEVRLTGWGIRDRHETLNSFRWGPDGWLYGCQGFATPSRVGRPAAGQERIVKPGEPYPSNLKLEGEGTPINGGVWRYHPIKERFEVVGHGFSNPWGIDFDAKGQCFITACVIPHVFHIIPGGIYHRQGGKHYNPHVYRDLRTITDHPHLSAHGGARIYLSDAFPREHRGRLFMCNLHQHAVLSDILEPKGSGFVARHGEDFMLANNGHWVGFSMEVGPAGNLYALDWHDADICGNSTVHKDTGRIFRIAPVETQAVDFPNRNRDLGALSDVELAELQAAPSDWHVRRARTLLQYRASQRQLNQAAVEKLSKQFATHPDGDLRLRALWALHGIGHADEVLLTKSLSDPDKHIRAWAIQLITEDKPPATALPTFTRLAREDSSPVVRLYLAAALQRFPLEQRWDLAAALIRRDEDVGDHNIPKMIWFGFEPLVPIDAKQALEIAASSMMTELKQWTARRAAHADQLEALTEALVRQDATHAFLKGMRDALRGRKELREPANWKAVYAKLSDHKEQAVRQLANELGRQFGDKAAGAKLLSTVTNRKAPVQARTDALRQLARAQAPELQSKLVDLFADNLIRVEAIRAMAAYDDGTIADALLRQYPTLSDAEKREAVQAFASRPPYGRRLMKALEAGTVRKSDIPVYVARQLRRVIGNRFTDVWGPVSVVPEHQAKQLEKYRGMLTEAAIASADARLGKTVFDRTCASCHKLYGRGQELGPDLTGSNRADLEYLLGNVVTPNADIQDAYRLVIVTTQDGRTFSGNIAAETDRQLTLRFVGSESIIDKAEIRSREVAPFSLMPEGLLDTLTTNEVVGLIRYLRTTEEIAVPKKRD